MLAKKEAAKAAGDTASKPNEPAVITTATTLVESTVAPTTPSSAITSPPMSAPNTPIKPGEWFTTLNNLTSLHCSALSINELIESNAVTKLLSHPVSAIYALHSLNNTSEEDHLQIQSKIEYIANYTTGGEC